MHGHLKEKQKAVSHHPESFFGGFYSEVHCTYNLLSNCSYNPIISWVTVVMGLITKL